MKVNEENKLSARDAKKKLDMLPEEVKAKVPLFVATTERLIWECEDGEVSERTLNESREGMMELIALMLKGEL